MEPSTTSELQIGLRDSLSHQVDQDVESAPCVQASGRIANRHKRQLQYKTNWHTQTPLETKMLQDHPEPSTCVPCPAASAPHRASQSEITPSLLQAKTEIDQDKRVNRFSTKKPGQIQCATLATMGHESGRGTEEKHDLLVCSCRKGRGLLPAARSRRAQMHGKSACHMQDSDAAAFLAQAL